MTSNEYLVMEWIKIKGRGRLARVTPKVEHMAYPSSLRELIGEIVILDGSEYRVDSVFEGMTQLGENDSYRADTLLVMNAAD